MDHLQHKSAQEEGRAPEGSSSDAAILRWVFGKIVNTQVRTGNSVSAAVLQGGIFKAL